MLPDANREVKLNISNFLKNFFDLLVLFSFLSSLFSTCILKLRHYKMATQTFLFTINLVWRSQQRFSFFSVSGHFLLADVSTLLCVIGWELMWLSVILGISVCPWMPIYNVHVCVCVCALGDSQAAEEDGRLSVSVSIFTLATMPWLRAFSSDIHTNTQTHTQTQTHTCTQTLTLHHNLTYIISLPHTLPQTFTLTAEHINTH